MCDYNEYDFEVDRYNTASYVAIGVTIFNLVFVRCVAASYVRQRKWRQLKNVASLELLLGAAKIILGILLFTSWYPQCPYSCYYVCDDEVFGYYPFICILLGFLWILRGATYMKAANAGLDQAPLLPHGASHHVPSPHHAPPHHGVPHHGPPPHSHHAPPHGAPHHGPPLAGPPVVIYGAPSPQGQPGYPPQGPYVQPGGAPLPFAQPVGQPAYGQAPPQYAPQPGQPQVAYGQYPPQQYPPQQYSQQYQETDAMPPPAGAPAAAPPKYL